MSSLRHVALLSLAAAHAVSAQDPVATRPKAPPVVVPDTAQPTVTQEGQLQPRRLNCWRAQRPCPGFFLTDIGLEIPVLTSTHPNSATSSGRSRDFPSVRIVWTVGFMGTSGRHSHGAAASLVAENSAHGVPFILEYRYRNWLGANAALDAGIGFKQSGFYAPPPRTDLVQGKGLSAMIALTPNRWIGLSARGDFMRAAGRDRRALMLGIQSTRVSEEAFKLVAVTIVQGLLAKIGIDTSNDNEQ